MKRIKINKIYNSCQIIFEDHVKRIKFWVIIKCLFLSMKKYLIKIYLTMITILFGSLVPNLMKIQSFNSLTGYSLNRLRFKSLSNNRNIITVIIYFSTNICIPTLHTQLKPPFQQAHNPICSLVNDKTLNPLLPTIDKNHIFFKKSKHSYPILLKFSSKMMIEP